MDLLLTHGYFLGEDPVEQAVMRPYPPLGLLYLSSHLKQRGYSVEVFDSTFRTFEELESTLVRERPGVVGVYVNLMTKPRALRIVALCRRLGLPVVVGGPDPSPNAEEYIAAGTDAVVAGEGELTLEELVPLLRQRPGSRDWSSVAGLAYRDERGTLVRTGPRAQIRTLDAQPFPDREAIDLGLYLDAWRSRHGRSSVSLLTARGCPYTCRWCSRAVFGESHRRRSPRNVADEVEQIVDRYRPDLLWYTDDVFTIHHGFLFEYAHEMARRGLRVPCECISRADRIDEGVADALARLGCFRLWIGSESGSQRVLDAMERRVTVERVRESTRLLQQRGIEVGMFLMLGYEGEERGDLEATVEHVKRTAPDLLLTTVAYPIKGTPYYEDVAARIVTRGEWAQRTDRDVTIRGRHSPRYYAFARQWVEGAWARGRHWRDGRYLRATRAAVRAGVGRLGMALTEGGRVA